MPPSPDPLALVEALDEPALLVAETRVLVANAAARDLLGRSIADHDVRLAIRHPAALDLILAGRSGDVEVSGIGGAERPWHLSIRAAGGDLLRQAQLFDLYRGESIPAGTKSLAYALSYQAEDRTLTDKEVDKAHKKIEDRLKHVLKAQIRGQE